MVDWDGNTPRENTSISRGTVLIPPTSYTRTLLFEHNSEANSDYPEPKSGQKSLKFNLSDITRLRYNSTIAQFNNQLEDLKLVFDGDLAKYLTSRYKVILASMTIDE